MTTTKQEEPKEHSGAGLKAPAPRDPYFPPPAGFDPPPAAVIPGQETDPAGVVGLMEEQQKGAKHSEGSKHAEDPKQDPKHSGLK